MGPSPIAGGAIPWNASPSVRRRFKGAPLAVGLLLLLNGSLWAASDALDAADRAITRGSAASDALDAAVERIAEGLSRTRVSSAPVAVLPFTRPDASPAPLGALFGVRLTGALQRRGKLALIDRAATPRLLREIWFGLTGAVDPATAQRVGRLAGASYLVAGTLSEAAGKIYCDARLISVETGKIAATARTHFVPDDGIPLAQRRSIGARARRPSGVDADDREARARQREFAGEVNKLSLEIARLERDRPAPAPRTSTGTTRRAFVIYDWAGTESRELRELAERKTTGRPRADIREARAALSRLAGDCASAERIYKKLIRRYPTPHAYLGLALCTGGRRGVRYAGRALRTSAEDPLMRWSAYAIRSALHLKRRDFHRARLDLREAVRRHHGLAGDFLLTRALALLALGSRDDARSDLQRALGFPLAGADRTRAHRLLSAPLLRD